VDAPRLFFTSSDPTYSIANVYMGTMENNNLTFLYLRLLTILIWPTIMITNQLYNIIEQRGEKKYGEENFSFYNQHLFFAL
jgi:hypothetical protein